MADYLPILLIPHRQVVSTACTPCRSLSSGVKQFGELFQLVALKYESDHVRWTVLTRA
ncbi:hypothetical protein [Streptococcus suis]|uniref:hypothetical protein n=1 Tax=Streptococcus suis TaxID=1307 RepID=UPI00040BCE4E|nr:hypothetical protein [Streptococcus suis]HEL2376193.1 hypothetical protein [Streptococcus suis]HEL2692383.1 hypothetical protein [Streptococcus suis]HEM3202056.1 hypothetical protein [Streptococcus suis 8830]